jgi:hypothetical protein
MANTSRRPRDDPAELHLRPQLFRGTRVPLDTTRPKVETTKHTVEIAEGPNVAKAA